MSESKSNRKTILLGALIIALLIGVCFLCVGLYAKREINKPKFTMPEQAQIASVSSLPNDKDSAAAYVSRLYAAAVRADDTEGSWRTEVHPEGEWETPFADADQSALLYIRDQAAGQIASFYPTVSAVRMSEAKDVPALSVSAQNVLDFTAEQGQTDENGIVRNADRYFISLTVDPMSVDVAAMTSGETFDKICKALSPVASLSDTQITPQSMTVLATIDRTTDHLLSLRIDRAFSVAASIRLTDESAALLPQRDAQITLPYATTQYIDIAYYGAFFEQRAIAVKPGDMKALPANVTVNTEATKADYTLTFVSSEPDVLTFDEDGVMTVERAFDDPVTVTMTLDYDGHTYTDELTVYITEWEVATDVRA